MSCPSSPLHQASLLSTLENRNIENSGWRVPAARPEQIVAGELRLLFLSSNVDAIRGRLNAIVGRLPIVAGGTENGT